MSPDEMQSRTESRHKVAVGDPVAILGGIPHQHLPRELVQEEAWKKI